MTREQCKELLPRLQRWADGETLQLHGVTGWSDIEDGAQLSFDAEPDRYRIKPMRVWVTVHSAGNVGCAYTLREHEGLKGKENRREFVEVIK